MLVKTTIRQICNKLGYEITKKSALKTESISNPNSVRSTYNNKSIQVHMFWAYGDLTNLEKLAVISFAENNFDLNLWTYGSIKNLPQGVLVRDAREIIPESRVFKYKNGSYAGFADLFRYAVLRERGGLWADTDVICLCSANDFKILGSEGFLVTERTGRSVQVNNNLIYHPNPTSGDIIDLAFNVSDKYQIDKLEWGDCGPVLLNTLVSNYPKLAPKIFAPDFANPVNWWDCPKKLLKEPHHLSDRTWFLHCFNERWRALRIEKNICYPPKSILGNIVSKYAYHF